jgi:hypothetical protein
VLFVVSYKEWWKDFFGASAGEFARVNLRCSRVSLHALVGVSFEIPPSSSK